MQSAGTPPVAIRSLAYQVADRLRTWIREGEWAAGSMLPPQATLAQRLGVSRATVREAAFILEAEGLLTIGRGKGTRVRLPPAPTSERSADTVSSIWWLLRAMEPVAAFWAGYRITPRQLAAISDLLETLPSCPQVDASFHRQVVAASQNPIFIAARTQCDAQGGRDGWPCHQADAAQTAHQQHRAIFAALASRNSREASILMAEHWNHGNVVANMVPPVVWDVRVSHLWHPAARSPGAG